MPMYLYFPMRNITTRAGPLTFAPVYTISGREADTDTARATADLGRVTTVVSLGTFREAGSLQSINPAAYFGDHFGDHTLCAVMNDPRVCARIAWPQTGHTLAVTSGNVLPPFTGGQVVAGSNPVSPTRITAGQGWFSGCGQRVRSLPGPYRLALAARCAVTGKSAGNCHRLSPAGAPWWPGRHPVTTMC